MEGTLSGTLKGTTVRFSRYVFQGDFEDKENLRPADPPQGGKALDFLRQVESIFAEDIAGTPVSPPGRNIPGLNADIAEVAERLQQVGFTTPNLYSSAKCRRVDRSNKLSTQQSAMTNANKLLEASTSMASATSIALRDLSTPGKSKAETVSRDGGDTPVLREKSYLRQTLASSRKRIIPDSSVKKSSKLMSAIASSSNTQFNEKETDLESR